MLNALFNIIIAPIIQILEFFFTLFFEITNNHGLAVIGLSIVVATLLVKDFYAHGPVKEDMTFMTNADTPYLATKDIVAGAKNPFTGFPFLVEDKAPFVKIQIAQAQSTRIRKQTFFPVPKDEWFTVHDNIFVKENWAPLFSDGQ